MVHPVGTFCGLDQTYRYQIRVLPVIPFLDTLHLLYEIYYYFKNTSHGSFIGKIHNAIGKVVEIRLQRNRSKKQDEGSDPQDGGGGRRDDGRNPQDDGSDPKDDGSDPWDNGSVPQDGGGGLRDEDSDPRDAGSDRQDDGSNPQDSPPAATLSRLVERSVHNTLNEYILTVICILQYVKLCGFHGIPMSFSLATGYFASWFINEIIYRVGQGHAVVESGQVTLSKQDSISLPAIPGGVVVLALVLQSLTIVSWAFSAIMIQGSRHHGNAPFTSVVWLQVFMISPLTTDPWSINLVFPTLDPTRRLFAWDRNTQIINTNFALFATSVYFFIIPCSALLLHSWYPMVHLPYYLYRVVFYAYLRYWGRGEEGQTERYPALSQPRLGLGLGISVLIYAWGLLSFYKFIFSPEGTWKAGWTENLP